MSENNTEIQKKEKLSPFRKREIIKTMLIIFLVGLLILTFFSNTIMNKSLSEITTVTVSSGNLTERVRGSGIVESNQTYEVKSEGNGKIDAIKVKSGKEVNEGDVLFVISGLENEALEAAGEELEAAEIEYEKALLAMPNDFAEEKRAVRDARNALTQAAAKRDAAAKNQSAAAQAKAQLNADKNESASLSYTVSRLSATIAAIDSDDYSAAAPEYMGDLAALCGNAAKAEAAYAEAYGVYSTAVEEGASVEVVNAALGDANSKKVSAEQAESIYGSEKSRIRSELASKLFDGENRLNAVNARIEAAEEASAGEGMSYEELAAEVQEMQFALDDATAALEKAQNESSIEGQKNNLDMEAQKKKIEAQKKKVEELKKKSGTVEVKSKYSGIVRSVDVKPDDEVMEDMVLAVIDIAEEGYTVSVNVTAEQAKKLKKGISAEVMNSWNGDITAVLRDIRNGLAGSNEKTLVFDVTGDAEAGSMMELSIPCGSGTYDTIVPKSAIKTDKDGDFILTVRSKSSPLGNRYYAEKTAVQVLASDESICAVSGQLDYGSCVITAGSKPVSDGDQVRMKDK